ncbi:MAG: DUF5615 family PIN-like protein [Saprospiraceae bacterium]|nr:DUF5615 family PIN-like protein [Candidatus Brachybacter algidus]
MKILIDANISWRLKEALKDFFEICTHVDSCELKVPASDLEIWNFAFENQYTILTNDLDFIRLSNLYGFPPKCIIIRTVNQSSKYISELIRHKKEDIRNFESHIAFGVLEIY